MKSFVKAIKSAVKFVLSTIDKVINSVDNFSNDMYSKANDENSGNSTFKNVMLVLLAIVTKLVYIVAIVVSIVFLVKGIIASMALLAGLVGLAVTGSLGFFLSLLLVFACLTLLGNLRDDFISTENGITTSIINASILFAIFIIAFKVSVLLIPLALVGLVYTILSSIFNVKHIGDEDVTFTEGATA